MTNSTGSATNWFRYTARQFDPDTALYNYRARYYDPTSGRFLSEDPIGFNAGGTNFYAYAAGNPVLFSDPTGNSPCLNIDAFLNWVDSHAKNSSTGNCAKAVRLGLEAGGLDTSGHPGMAKDYGPFLQNIGFAPVSQKGYTPQSGDIVVIQPGPTPSGHVEVWDGTIWVSDFIQNPSKPSKISPYKGVTSLCGNSG